MAERDLTPLERVDHLSREHWSIAAAEALIRSRPDAIQEIAVRGFDEFARCARPEYFGHAFQFEDFQRMFERIVRAANAQLAASGHRQVQ